MSDAPDNNTPDTPPTRKWRTWSRRRDTVVITGIGGRLGLALARRLHRRWAVIGVDRRPIDVLAPDIEFHQVDIRRRQAEDVFRTRRVDALIHLNIMHDPRKSTRESYDFNVRGTQKLLDLCQQHNVSKVIVLSSANVYGPSPTNNQFLTEEAPLMGSQTWGELGALIALDMFAGSFFWRHPEIETVILRPANIVGDVRNAISHYLRQDRIPTLLGYDPMIQLVHVEDVVQAIERSLRPGHRGIYNIAGPGALPLSRLIDELGKPRLVLPEPLARPLYKALWRARLSSFPVAELDHIKYICMIDDTRARQELGYNPEKTMAQTLLALK